MYVLGAGNRSQALLKAKDSGTLSKSSPTELHTSPEVLHSASSDPPATLIKPIISTLVAMPNLLAHLSVFFSAPSLSEIAFSSLFPCYLFPLGHASSTRTSYSCVLDSWQYSSYWVFNLCFFDELITEYRHSRFAWRRLRGDVNRTCHFVISLRGPSHPCDFRAVSLLLYQLCGSEGNGDRVTVLFAASSLQLL